MAKVQSAQDAVMDLSEVKRVLKMAGNATVESGGVRLPIVVALDNENEAMVMVAKRGSGRKLRGDAIKAIKREGVEDKIDAQAAKMFFGYAFTSASVPGALMISVNKKPPGEGKLTKAIFKRVRTAGFSDVVLTVDDSIENETEEEGDGTNVPPAPPPPPVQNLDAAGLRKRLGSLATRIGAIGQNDQAYRATLLGLANDANAALKGENLQQAAEALDALEAALNQPPVTADIPPADGGENGASLVKMQKSRLIWQGVRKKIAGEFDQFKNVVSTRFAGDPDEGEIVEALDDLDDILIALDERLIDALDDLLDGDLPPADRERLAVRARSIVDEYVTFASSDPLLKKLDGDTPFGMKFTAAATVDAALKALRQTIG